MNIEATDKITDKELFNDKRDKVKLDEFLKIRRQKAPEFCRVTELGKYDEIFSCVMENCEIYLNNDRFVYFIDALYIPPNNRGIAWDNLSVDYRKILSGGLKSLKYQEEDNSFCVSYNNVINQLILLSERIIKQLEIEKPDSYKKKQNYFRGMKDQPARGFEEALQRILFLNQVLWQMNHPLMGFGLLDTILDPYYEMDKKAGKIDQSDAVSIIKDFYYTLHRYYWYKSHALMGDTGQLVIVGRKLADGGYFCNDLSYVFIEALKEAQLPDPKVLLRVSENMPEDLLRTALECIATGIGAPVLANDDVIIPLLMAAGIEEQDSYEYATSACWEPLIAWKSPVSNNLSVLNFMTSFENMIKREPLHNIGNMDEFLERYQFYLCLNLQAVKRSLHNRRFSYDPLVSAFMGGCYEKKLDVSEGGAVYNNYGITSIGLGNVVNALINIKTFVFDKQLFTLEQVKKMLLMDFEAQQDIIHILKDNQPKYGSDNENVIYLTNYIMKTVTKETNSFRNYLGGKLKFGLSSPAYIDAGKGTGASFDGRKAGEPFIVHISSEQSDGYTELVNFASQLDLTENRYNGNVVDFVVTPNFMTDHFEKWVSFIKGAIRQGFFEMQVGVLSSEMLLMAQKNPELYPNLIVRVWGFSAYFNDLPLEYQEVIIQRALHSEGKAG